MTLTQDQLNESLQKIAQGEEVEARPSERKEGGETHYSSFDPATLNVQHEGVSRFLEEQRNFREASKASNFGVY